MPEDLDPFLRLAAFEALRVLTARHGPVLTRAQIQGGFSFRGQTIQFATKACGIFKPKEMKGGALSVTTTAPPRPGRHVRYADLTSDEGFVYRLQDGHHATARNTLLRTAYEERLPMVYFFGLQEGHFAVHWPVYIQDLTDDACILVADDVTALKSQVDGILDAGTTIRRRYATVEVKKRLHQAAFRLSVLEAYDCKCAICHFPGTELLDAAHILPDRDVRGEPEVPNGLALCRLHHGAFDTNLLGIRPADKVVVLSETLRAMRDGPTLRHGLQGFDQQPIRVPRRAGLQPREDYLNERWDSFLERAG